MTEVAVAGITGALGASGALGAAYVTARKSQRATEQTAEVQQKALDVDRNDRFVQRLLERLDQVEEDNAAAVSRLSDMRREHDREIREMREQYDRDLRDMRGRYEELYARALRERLGSLAPEHLRGLDLD